MKKVKAQICLAIVLLLIFSFCTQADEKPFRLGIIGLDTSHAVNFTKYLNNPENKTGCRVVAGYPGGSPDIPSSIDRVPEYTTKLRDEYGLEIVSSIEELCKKVDGVLLESVDGRPHLEQVKPVFAAKKPVYIDKPMAGSLTDVLEIFELARQNNIPCWSSSSLRFMPSIIGMRNNETVGQILGCHAFSPCALEEHHPDFYWYGIHGVEILFTIMGPGCVSVSRSHAEDADIAVGVWADGRIASFRGTRKGRHDYGALVFGAKGNAQTGGFDGYGHMLDKVALFFKTGEIPVSPEETINLFAFMTAADESKKLKGAAVSIASVMDKAKKELAQRRSCRAKCNK